MSTYSEEHKTNILKGLRDDSICMLIIIIVNVVKLIMSSQKKNVGLNCVFFKLRHRIEFRRINNKEATLQIKEEETL